MNSLRTIPILLIIVCFFTGTTSAQSILERAASKAKEKLEQKAEKKVDQKIDETIDQGIEKIENSAKGDRQEDKDSAESAEVKNQRRMQGLLKGLGVSGEPVPFDESYSFTSKIQMHIETIDGKGEKTSDGEFITYYHPERANFAYEVLSENIGAKGKGIFIFDFANKASIMLSEDEGKRTGIVYGLNASHGEDSDSAEVSSEDLKDIESQVLDPHLTKTGRSRNILGYSCDEYHYNNPEEKTEGWYWITRDIKLKNRDFYGTFLNIAAWSSGMAWGQMMEAEFIDRSSGEKSIMKVTDIDNNVNKKFVMSDYQVTNIGSINIPTGE
jgi:hypothetical protein